MKALVGLIPLLALGGCVVHERARVVVGPPAPVVVEEPVAVEEFYFYNGNYYYWHPGFHRYDIWVGELPRGYAIRRWGRLPGREEVVRFHEREHFVAPHDRIHVEHYRRDRR